MRSSEKLILTTEKDGVRMKKFESELAEFPLYVLPIRHHFLFGEEDKFKNQVVDFIRSYKKDSITD